MPRRSFRHVALLFGLALLASPSLSRAAEEEDEEDLPARLRMYVPADALVEIGGALTRQTGTDRSFVTPPLSVGMPYMYRIKLTYTNATGKQVVENHKVRIVSGQEKVVDLRPGADKVSVDFVEKKSAPSGENTLTGSERSELPWVATARNITDAKRPQLTSTGYGPKRPARSSKRPTWTTSPKSEKTTP